MKRLIFTLAGLLSACSEPGSLAPTIPEVDVSSLEAPVAQAYCGHGQRTSNLPAALGQLRGSVASSPVAQRNRRRWLGRYASILVMPLPAI